jgi:DNA polymerase
MKTLVIDFETAWNSKDYTLKRMSGEAYIRDPRFKAFGIGIKYLGSTEKPTWIRGVDIPEWASYIDWTTTATLAHNAMFDNAILAWRYGVVPMAMFDTLSMARALRGVDAGGSLAALAKHFGLPPKGDEVHSTDGLTELPLAIEQGLATYCAHDVWLCEQVFKNFMEQGFAKSELQLIDMTVRMFVEPKLELDLDMLKAHLHDVKTTKDNLLINAAVDRTELASNPKFAELLARFGVEAPRKVSAKTGKETWAFAKTDEGFKALAEHPDPVVQALVAARLGTKSTLEETRTELFIQTAQRGKFPVPLKYYGARTGRWSGEVYNMQNIPRNSKLKYAIRAPKGQVLVGIDLSNIELRVGLWLAGQMQQLQMLADGVDLYKDFASKVFNVDYDDVTKDQRFIGKTSQLSLIYGVGHAKLRSAVKTGSGVDIGEEESRRIVSLYREDYSGVAGAWKSGEQVLRCVANDMSMDYGRNGIIKVMGKAGCQLPNGMFMQYPGLEKIQVPDKIDPEIMRSQWVYYTRKGREGLYGAKVFQGLTQALARCIMGDGMRRTAKRYPVALTIHDAEYFLAPETDGEVALAFAHTSLCTPPSWGLEIPLNAEGAYGATLGDC